MRKIIIRTIVTLLALLPVAAAGQQYMKRGNCLSFDEDELTTRGQAPRRLKLLTDWDPSREYPVAVILVSFADTNFAEGHDATFYDRLFNEKGFNENYSPGSVRDYFIAQSDGWFHPRFDIYGPYKSTRKAKENGTHGQTAFREAAMKMADSLSIDFTPYDWNEDGRSEHVVFVYAGCGGNEAGKEYVNCIWPSTGDLTSFTVGSTVVNKYSASAERWSNGLSCGLGTICHEFSHVLGLPDLYPTSGSEYSVVDEWDLMDGGNFTNAGWCPPCYSIHEKMLLGWARPETLTMPASIDSLRSTIEGGKTYLIPTDNEDEFFLLENRQWKDWDSFLPGHGLIISHVHYDQALWSGNMVNTTPTHHRYELVHADNMDYDAWYQAISDGLYPQRERGHNLIMSSSPYPFITDSTENRSFSDTTIPAAITFTGTGLLGKPLTKITEHANHTVSFRFMKGETDAIREVATSTSRQAGDTPIYNMEGQRLSSLPRHGLYIRNGKIFFVR